MEELGFELSLPSLEPQVQPRSVLPKEAGCLLGPLLQSLGAQVSTTSDLPSASHPLSLPSFLSSHPSDLRLADEELM